MLPLLDSILCFHRSMAALMGSKRGVVEVVLECQRCALAFQQLAGLEVASVRLRN